MLFTTIVSLASVAFAAPFAAPAELAAEQAQVTGYAYIFNRCAFDVNYWINNEGPHVLPAGANWGERFSTSGSRTITLMTSTGLFTDNPKVLMGYTYRPDQGMVYYDLYSPGGKSPFQGSKVIQKSVNPSCRSNIWDQGVPVPGEHQLACASDRDVTLSLCAK
jgi:hypothetical protein